jgi:hypothetical protein
MRAWMMAWPVFVLWTAGCNGTGVAGTASCRSESGTVVSFPSGVTNAVRVGDWLYFDTASLGSIARVPLAGGDIETLVESGADGEWAAGAETFAWVEEIVTATSDHPATDRLHIHGPGAEAEDITLAPGNYVVQLRADSAGNLTWLQSQDTGLRRRGLDGTRAVIPLQSVYGAYAVDDDHVYWLDGNARLNMAPIAGGGPIILASFDTTRGGVGIIGVDGAEVYLEQVRFGPSQQMTVTAVSRLGAVRTVVTNAVPPYSTQITMDDDYVYWVEQQSGSINAVTVDRARKSGGAIEKVTTTPGVLAAITVDACNLYLINESTMAARSKGP